MAVFQNRPYERHIVSNIPTLLSTGSTLDQLAVGQIGIFDAKTNLAVTAPTYAANKAIYIAQGTPDRSNFPEGAGVPNILRKTHTIQGKRLISLRGKKGNLGYGELVTLGFDGVDVSKTLTAKPGETFYYWVRLTGDPIFNLNPDRSKGVIIQGAVQMPCADECSDNCGTVDCNTIADLVVADYNTKLLPGGQKANKYVQISKILGTCEAPTPEVTLGYCTLVVPDNGTDYDLGQVQAQFPGAIKLSRDGVFTTYALATDNGSACDCPTGSYNAPNTVIYTDCASGDCDALGGTFAEAADVYEFKTEGVLSGGNITTLQNAIIATVATDSVITLVQTDVNINVSTYKVTVVPSGAISAATVESTLAGAGVSAYIAGSSSFVGVQAATCTISGATYSWSGDCVGGTICNLYTGTFKATVGNTCNAAVTAAEVEALYPTGNTPGSRVGSVTIVASNDCNTLVSMNILSECVVGACNSASELVFKTPVPFRGYSFTKVEADALTGCVCGLQFESVYVPRQTKECTFDQFAYQTDWVHVEVSSHNPDWRSTDLCEVDPIATRIRHGAYPNGAGQAVARLEKQDRMYDMDYFYMSPVLREAFDFYFETDLQATYDMVAVEYEFQYSSNNGFGQSDNDRYIQYFWLPEGQAGALVAALNGYAASVPVQVDPIVL
jgi:hypothetical protein